VGGVSGKVVSVLNCCVYVEYLYRVVSMEG
jgi:hypothetical protein